MRFHQNRYFTVNIGEASKAGQVTQTSARVRCFKSKHLHWSTFTLELVYSWWIIRALWLFYLKTVGTSTKTAKRSKSLRNLARDSIELIAKIFHLSIFPSNYVHLCDKICENDLWRSKVDIRISAASAWWRIPRCTTARCSSQSSPNVFHL